MACDRQGLIFGISMEGGAVKLYDVRHFDKVRLINLTEAFVICYDTFLITSSSQKSGTIRHIPNYWR